MRGLPPFGANAQKWGALGELERGRTLTQRKLAKIPQWGSLGPLGGPIMNINGPLGDPHQVLQRAPSRSLGGPIGALRGLNWGS
jgi:hypothetical protein